MPRFSICIPNFNYAQYIPGTVASVLSQDVADLEVCISDNSSTDDSVQRVHAIGDDRVRISVNSFNRGFAQNLDCAAQMAEGRTLITLSSDDMMLPGAIGTYAQILDCIDEQTCVIGSAIRVIDADGETLGRVAASPGTFRQHHLDQRLSELTSAEVYSAPASEILAGSIRRMRNPYHFATVAFPHHLYEKVGGYTGQRLYNPDKWFNWRLLEAADRAYFVNADLFAYRWHSQNQASQQHQSGALKFLVDEYVSTFQLTDSLLERLGISRTLVAKAFVHNDIVLRGFRDVASGDWRQARRAIHWALATYPHQARTSASLWALRLAASAGPLGAFTAKLMLRNSLRFWRQKALASEGLHDTWHP